MVSSDTDEFGAAYEHKVTIECDPTVHIDWEMWLADYCRSEGEEYDLERIERVETENWQEF